MEQKDVFLSYKAEEFDDANWVKATLENNGISCWMAPMSIPGGSSYAAEIPQAIRQCKAFVLILSEKSQESKWVPRELDQAINENKTVMPFMLENCALKDDFNFYLTNVQRYTAYENKSKAIEKMIREIRAIIEAECDLGKKEPEEPDTKPDSVEIEPTIANSPKVKREPKASSAKGKNTKIRKLPIIMGAAGLAVVGLICLIAVYINSMHFSIAGEKYSVSDSYVQISNAELSDADMENLLRFKEVRTIRLEACTFKSEDLSRLSISSLHILSLSDCHLNSKQIGSIDFSAMDQLYDLDLSGNEGLSSLDSLSEITDIVTTLKISNTSITEIDNIGQFQHLKEFRADNNSITNINGLASCAELTLLSVNGNKISDLTPLSHNTKLTTLCVNGNNLTLLSGLEHCIELQEVQAGSNKLESLSALENATLLRVVFLNDNQIDDISVLAKSARSLQRVYLRNNKVTEIDAFASCSSLTYLNIDNNLVSSLVSLANCSQLIALSAADNQLDSMSGLEEKKSLTFLNLANNQISLNENDTFSFSDTERVTVELSGNQIVALNLPKALGYRYLGLHRNQIKDYESLYATTGFNLVLDYSDKIDFEALSAGEYLNCSVVNCPLDKQVSVREQLGKYSTEFIEDSECTDMIEQFIPDAIKGVVEYYR